MQKVSRIPLHDGTEKSRPLEITGNPENETCVFVNATGTILYVNPDFERTAGYSRYEVLGKNVGQLRNGGPDSVFYGEIRNHLSFSEGDARSVATDQSAPDSPTNGKVMIAPLCDSSGAVSHYVAIRRNGAIPAKRDGDSAKPELWESVRRFTGTAAHHFNNLLTAVLGYSDLLQRTIEDREPEKRYVDGIQSAGNQAALLTRQLLAFSQDEMFQPREFSLNSLVSGMIRKLRTRMGKDIELVTDLSSDTETLYADAGKIEQLILNLADNARDAMPRGGRITIETSTLLLRDPIVRQNALVRRGAYVTLSVHDTGCGMDEMTRFSVFEPFFSTKTNALGLGMSEVFGIIRQSRGYVWIHSAQDQGTTVTAYFPVRKGAAPAESGNSISA